MYRMFRFSGQSLSRDNMICLDDRQFLVARRLVREVFGGEITSSKTEVKECNP